MKEEFVNDAEIRRFLLGSVDDPERQQIESRFISDPEINSKILIAEEDLIEDYLENLLAPEDRDRFLAQYSATPRQRRSLRIVRSIREHAASGDKLTSPEPAIEKWRGFVSALSNLKLLIPLAAALIIACVVGLWLIRLNHRNVAESARRQAVDRELAELNARPEASENSSQVVSLVLPPISTRSVGPQSELTRRGDIRLVEIDLLWTQKEQYPSYQALVRCPGSSEEFKISGLHIENGPRGNIIRVRLPMHLLKNGFYQIILMGVRADAEPSANDEYSFSVAG